MLIVRAEGTRTKRTGVDPLPPIIVVRMHPSVRRDLALLRELDHVHRRRVSPLLA